MSATTATYTIQIRASTETKTRKESEAWGKSPRLNRISPYAQIFSRTAARINEPAVGASVCASGSHVCSGNSGTFTAKATKNPRKSHRAAVTESESLWSWVKSNVGLPNCDPDLKYRNRMATSRNAEPAMVNRKNLMAA